MGPRPTELSHELTSLARELELEGAEIFDLVIALTARRAGIEQVYTFDPAVLGRVPGLTARTP